MAKATGFKSPLGSGYHITQKYNNSVYHLGEDWSNSNHSAGVLPTAGGPVFATANGTVKFAGSANGYGPNFVAIEHTLEDGTKVTSYYGHMEPKMVSKFKEDVLIGQQIDIGQQIGTVGNEGNSDAPHLHFAIFVGPGAPTIAKGYNHEPDEAIEDRYADPTLFLSKHPVPPSDPDPNKFTTPSSSSSSPQADLKVAKFWLEDTSLSTGQDMRANLNVQNSGSADAKGETSFYWSADKSLNTSIDKLVDSDTHGTLTKGELDTNEHETIKYDVLAKHGSGYIFAVIDAEGVVPESNEGNNVAGPIKFTTPSSSSSDPNKFITPNSSSSSAQADLKVAKFWLDDAVLLPGQDMRANLHVQNSGSADAKGETSFYWSADKTLNTNIDKLVDSDTHGTLTKGELDTNEYEIIKYDVLAKHGSGYIFAAIDAEGVVPESNENNNVYDALAFWI